MTAKRAPVACRSVGALACGLVAAAASGQAEPEVVQRLERQLRLLDQSFRQAVPEDQPIAGRLLLDYGGTTRFGFFAIDAAAGDTRVLRQYDLRLYLRAELDRAHRFFGRLRFLYEDWNSGDSFDGRDDEFEDPIGDRYWYQFDLRGAVQAERGETLPYNVNLKIGRQYLDWATGLTLSDVVYAALLDVEAFDVGVLALAGITPGSDTIDFDGSRPGFDSDTKRAYVGVATEYRGWSSHRPYAYFLAQRDNNDRDFRVFDGPLTPIPTRFHYDSNYAGVGARGSLGNTLRYRAELVHESGEGLSNSFDTATGLPVPQTFEDIDAWAGVAGLTWLRRDDGDTRFDFEAVAASGDDDRLDASNTFGGNLPDTDDTSFNSLGFVDTGLALAPDPANLLSLRLSASTYPFPDAAAFRRLRAGISGYLFFKIDEDAPLDVATLAEPFVGGELDFLIDWRIASDVSASLRYGLFLPGDAMPPGEDDPRHFFYVGLSYAF